MAIEPVPADPVAPEFPPTSAKALGTYNTLAYAWGQGMPAFGAALKALAVNVYNNALQVFDLAGGAEASALAAANSSLSAAASSNFKGNWSSLSGALAVPASVYHNGGLWLLVSSTADVTTITPGVSAQWVPAQTLTRLVHVTGTSATALPYDHLSLENAGVSTGNLPATAQDGAIVVISTTNGRFDNVVGRNGGLIMGLAQDMTLDVPGTYTLKKFSSSLGWRLV